MMTDDNFDALVDEIMALGHDEETAAYWASLISDRPLIEAGNVVVLDQDGRELARLPLQFFNS